jgi:hypothetical protein
MFHFAPGAVPDLLYILYFEENKLANLHKHKRYDFIKEKKYLYCVQLNEGWANKNIEHSFTYF